jgi:hypothetical protein
MWAKLRIVVTTVACLIVRFFAMLAAYPAGEGLSRRLRLGRGRPKIRQAKRPNLTPVKGGGLVLAARVPTADDAASPGLWSKIVMVWRSLAPLFQMHATPSG